ncbi:MAG TPA: prepilin-type N-terminal cleavage/methylation domain-containing protein [Lacunisphaera sp.]|nr:prepilin-type N-terminal cleavage/methylation domain-containing protein [Lacunisphaera sp.]
MTTIILSPGRNRRAGFTLVELMIGAALSSFILAGVLSTFLFIGRSGANVQNYNDMEAQARKALEYFAEDTRQASAVTWGSDNTSLTLTVNSLPVVYAYSTSAKTFSRQDATSTKILVSGITSFAFSAYKINTDAIPLATSSDLTAANGTTKQLQISLEASRTSTTVVAATNTVLSARFILRNKKVTA